MYKQILVAVDSSEYSERALAHAETLARAFDAQLSLVHVFPSLTTKVGSSDYDIVLDERKEAGRQVLEAMQAKLEDRERVVPTKLVEGPEAEALVNTAEAQQADLIVMGSRGLGAMAGVLLGSVSRQVARHAPCSVLIVR